jgi:CHAD domain-containing protein
MPTLVEIAVHLLKISALQRLGERSRLPLLAAAGWYAAARAAGAERLDRAARDLALIAPYEHLSASDRLVAACSVALQRPKPRPERETTYLRLRAEERDLALALAAVLRLALACEAQSVSGIRFDSDAARLELAATAPLTADTLADAADLWHDHIGKLELCSVEAADPIAPLNGELPQLPPVTTIPGPLLPDETLAEGARRVLRAQFERMLAREQAVAADEDPEDVHQMRVWTRRLRASLQVVEEVFEPQMIRRYRRGLREVARALGEVRDDDVFLLHIDAYAADLPEERRAQLEPIQTAIRTARAAARRRLLADFESKRYRRLKREFAVFLTSPGMGLAPLPETGCPARVRDLAGGAIWRRYEALRAFEIHVPNGPDEMLHAARIAGKRLRYTLEFYADALGSETEKVLEPLMALQELLGELQDAVVARMRVQTLGLLEDAGAQGYLADREAEHADLRQRLPALWRNVAGRMYQNRLLKLIGGM